MQALISLADFPELKTEQKAFNQTTDFYTQINFLVQ